MRVMRFFWWVIIPVAVYLAYLTMGLPHFIWSYSWRDNGTYDPFAYRYYTSCTFIGPYGNFTVPYPRDGKCGWIIFKKRQGVPQKEAVQTDKAMTTDNLKKINSILELKQLRRVGSAMLKGQEKRDFTKIHEKFDKQRVVTERLYAHEYKTRVQVAYRDLLNKAGSKTMELKPSFFGIDRFNKDDLNRQAQLNVRLDHQQSMDRLDRQESSESKSLLNKCSQRKKYLESFKKSTERRRAQTRRQGSERRRSQSISD